MFVVLSVSALTTAASAQMADYYPLAIGSKWTYKVTASSAENTVVKTMEVEMTGKENVGGVDCYMKKYTMEGRIIQEECYAWENNKLLLYKGTVELSGTLTSVDPRPPQVLLVTPLETGGKWSWSGECSKDLSKPQRREICCQEMSAHSATQRWLRQISSASAADVDYFI